MKSKALPKRFFDCNTRFNSYIDNIGYCVNCGELNIKEKSRILEDLNTWLCMAIHGYIRVVDIKCKCGSKKGIHDMDVENYILYDIKDKSQA